MVPFASSRLLFHFLFFSIEATSCAAATYPQQRAEYKAEYFAHKYKKYGNMVISYQIELFEPYFKKKKKRAIYKQAF